MQHAYRLRTDDGYDTGRVDGAIQSFVPLPVFDRSRRSVLAQVRVWTDLGESGWSEPVRLESGLLGEQDWQARWIGVQEAERPEEGSRPAYWLRTVFDVPPSAGARLYLTALGLYEAFLDGHARRRRRTHAGYTQYRARVQYQAYDVDVSSLRPGPGRHVLAVLLADGWYRGQVGLLRAADQYGDDVALRAQLEVRTGAGWQVAAASQPARAGELRRPTSPRPTSSAASERTGGGSTGRARPVVRGPAWREAVSRDVDVAIVRSVAPPVRRVEEIQPAAVRPVRGGDAFVVDFGQNFSGWVRLARPGPRAAG